MSHRNRPRSVLLPTLAALAAALGAGARVAEAGDRPAQPGVRITGKSASGYPRSDEGTPPPYGNSGGSGESQGGSGKSYDSNYVIWDGLTSDVIVYDVMLACIDGRGHESDSNGYADTSQLTAWGADKVTFTCPGDGQATEIVVHNPIDIYASWHLRGNGSNFVDLLTAAYDVCGGRHDLTVKAGTSVVVTGATSDKRSTSIRASSRGSVGGSTGGELTVEGDAEGTVTVSAEHTSTASANWTEGADVQGSARYSGFAMLTHKGNSLTVEIQTEESMTVSAQAKAFGQDTTVDVPHHNTDNVVTGSYVTLTGGPGTPGGDNSSGPGTPGGDGGGSPPTGGTPGGDGGGSTPTGGSGSEPLAPPEPPKEPVQEPPLPGPDPLPGSAPEPEPELPPAPPAPPETGSTIG